jgi:hypothetical protein
VVSVKKVVEKVKIVKKLQKDLQSLIARYRKECNELADLLNEEVSPVVREKLNVKAVFTVTDYANKDVPTLELRITTTEDPNRAYDLVDNFLSENYPDIRQVVQIAVFQNSARR